ncbi:MAG: transcriptional repressor [Bacteroidota bacterium]
MTLAEHIREKGLKATPVRLLVLELLQNNQQAYSHTEMEAAFTEVDRITLYRVLRDFEEAGMVHKIMDIEGITRFAVCKHSCPDSTHSEDHVHFNCQVCHKMYCLEMVTTPAVKLPAGFRPTGINTLIHGVCKHCG